MGAPLDEDFKITVLATLARIEAILEQKDPTLKPRPIQVRIVTPATGTTLEGIDTGTVVGRIKHILRDHLRDCERAHIDKLNARIISFNFVQSSYAEQFGPINSSTVSTILSRMIKRGYLHKAQTRGYYKISQLFFAAYMGEEPEQEQ